MKVRVKVDEIAKVWIEITAPGTVSVLFRVLEKSPSEPASALFLLLLGHLWTLLGLFGRLERAEHHIQR